MGLPTDGTITIGTIEPETGAPVDPPECAFGLLPHLRYTVRGTGGTLRISTCHDEFDFLDGHLTMSFGDCGDSTCREFPIDGVQCSPESSTYSFEWKSLPNVTYFVNLGGLVQGSFGVSVIDLDAQLEDKMATCLNAMADAEKRASDSDFLNQNEYVLFVNEMSNNAFRGLVLAEFPRPLRQNFFQLRGENKKISIFGCKPNQVPNVEQQAHLELVCNQTKDRINEVLGGAMAATDETTRSPRLFPSAVPSLVPTVPPSLTPSLRPSGVTPTASPTFSMFPSIVPTESFSPTLDPTSENGFTGDIIIESIFSMANIAGLTAASLGKGTRIGDSLGRAYSQVASRVVLERGRSPFEQQAPPHKLKGKVYDSGRRLRVEYVESSATVDRMFDFRCPNELSADSICQIVYASFNISVISEDADTAKNGNTQEMNAAIKDGYLQEALPRKSPLLILGNVLPSEAPSESQSGSPTREPSNGNDGLSPGGIAGLTIFSFVAVAAFGAGGYYMYAYRKRTHPDPTKPQDAAMQQPETDSVDDWLHSVNVYEP